MMHNPKLLTGLKKAHAAVQGGESRARTCPDEGTALTFAVRIVKQSNLSNRRMMSTLHKKLTIGWYSRRFEMRKRILLLSLLVVFALLMAACAPAEPGEPGLEETPGLGVTPGLTEEPGLGLTPEVTLEPTLEVTVEPTVMGTEEPTLAVTEMLTETPGAEATPGTGFLETNPSLASDLLGLGVRNPDGENLGEIEEIVVDRQSGQIHYVVLGAGGFLGIGEKLVLVPWGALGVHVDAQEVDQLVTLNIDQEVLANAPNFDPNDLPDVNTPDWDADVRAYWQEHVEMLPVTGESGQPANLFRLSDPTDIDAQNTAGEDIGDIENLVLDLETGQITHVILATGGVMDLGECLLPVPWEALMVSSEEGMSEVETTPETGATPAAGVTPTAVGTPAAAGTPEAGETGIEEADDFILVLDTTGTDLANAPCFATMDEFPDTRTPEWDADIRNFWANPTAPVETAAPTTAATTTP
jgi:sporulation protein YlmC with PRC-barrel domain